MHIDLNLAGSGVTTIGQHRDDIQRAKGLAILLVVFGHLVARDLPEGGRWYEDVKHFVYGFHMPFFMWISGFVFALRWDEKSPLGVQLCASWNRTKRILPAFVVMGLIVFLGKSLASNFVRIDNPISGSLPLLDLLIRPTKSFSQYLWYIYVLSGLFMLAPLLVKALRSSIYFAAVFTAGFWLLPASDWFAWPRFQQLSVFFFVGIIYQRHEQSVISIIDRWWPLFVLFLLPAYIFTDGNRLSCGLVAIPGLFGMIRSRIFSRSKILVFLGDFTFSIYLFNTLFIGVAKALLSTVISWHGPAFLFYLPVLLASGLFLPPILKRAIAKQVPSLNRYI